MQKRLLALVATVAMVLSMFAGIAFAEEEYRFVITDKQTAYKAGVEFNKNEPNILPASVKLTGPSEPKVRVAKVTYTGPEGGVLKLHAIDTNSVWHDMTQVGWGPEGGFNIDPDLATEVYPEANKAGVYTVTFQLVDVDNNKVLASQTEKLTFVDAKSHKIILSQTKVISSGEKSYGYQLIQGSVVLANNASDGNDFVIEVGDEENIEENITAKGGHFSFYLPTNVKPCDVKVTAKINGITVATETIKIRYNVTTDPAELEFAYAGGEHSPVVIKGTVTDSNGKPVQGAMVNLWNTTDTGEKVGDEGYVAADIPTNAAGEFAFVVNKWDAATNIGLFVDDQLHVMGEVKGIAATLKVTPNSNVVHTVAPTQLTVEGSGFKGDDDVDITIKNGDSSTHFATVSNEQLENGAFKVIDNWLPLKAGTYTVTAKQANYSATATITVINPTSYNLINAGNLNELPVGPKTLTFGTGGIELVKYPTPTEPVTFYYTILVDGKAVKVDGTTYDFVKKTAGSVTITSTKLAERTIQVIVHVDGEKDGEYVKVFDKTYTAKVTGWAVDMDVTSLTVNQAQTITFVVTDADGNPVNNATVEIVGSGVKALSPANYNAQNGTYIFKDVKITTPGTYKVEVKSGATLKATLNLSVVGQKVYSLSSDVGTLLQGKAEDVNLTITRDGQAVIPQRIKLIDKDNVVKEVGFTPLADGVTKINVNADKAGKLVVRVENFDGTLCGETELEVVAPKLVLVDEDVANITEDFKTKVHFKVVDPRDGEVLTNNVALYSDWADLKVYDANGGSIVSDINDVFTILGDEEHVLTILAEKAEYEDAEEEEEVVAVLLKVNDALVDGHFEIKKATITSDPEMIIIGAKNNLTLTYLDANGKPIVGKTVKANNADLGKTDDNGQVIYPAGVVAEPVKVVASTDTTAMVEKTIKIGYDFEAPKVTYEVDGNKATLVITDNVRLVRINIDGKDIDFWPGARYEHVVTLNPGVNKVRVKAQDSNDNVLDEVVEIEYKTDSVKLEGETVKRQGDFLFVQLRQFEELGAQIAWNQATRTATFVVGDTKVEITVGSTTAMVNGQAVTMPVAAFIDAALGRTYVPVRFVSEALGWNVHWAQGDIVTITLP